MKFWVEATVSAAVSILNHTFRGMWRLPGELCPNRGIRNPFSRLPFQTWTLLMAMQNSLMVKTWPAVHCMKNCLPLLQFYLEKETQLKALYSCTLRTCFPCLSPAQLPSLTSISSTHYSWRGFYHTLDFLPFRQTVLQIRFPFKTTVKISTFKQDTFPLTGRHYCWGKGPGLAKSPKYLRIPLQNTKPLAVSSWGII